MGSSPLTRGKRRSVSLIHSRRGLIPAHAGKTTTLATREYASAGSSPLTRGKLTDAAPPTESRRLIPAHAGKTRSLALARESRKAHPRSRGENQELIKATGAVVGSSPLTRGKPNHHDHPRTARGLIPAHAGKTFRWYSGLFDTGAHPRSRGENAAYVGDVPNDTGSSPLTRGKPRAPCRSWFRQGLIPAHAGKTKRSACQTACCTAHPRSRGENRLAGSRHRRRRGSSPLTRGKRSSGVSSVGLLGLIPAHAGKTRPAADR